jgi:hypothetical protein
MEGETAMKSTMKAAKKTELDAENVHNSENDNEGISERTDRSERENPEGLEEGVSNLLYEALETEKGGVLVYETALRCAVNEELGEEWEKYLEQTRNHVTILLDVFQKVGLDPEQETPGQQVVRHVGESLVSTMEMALEAGEAAAAEIVAAECVVLAETKDHMNWELIGATSKTMQGETQKALKAAYDKVEDEEDEHLYHTAGWARELHLQALGLPAELPPTEEKKDVKSELEAATARKQRKAKLTKQQSNGDESADNLSNGKGRK